MTRLPLRRWWPRIQAWLMRMPWRLCPYCGAPFGAQEDSGTNHFPALLGGEDDQVILCPSCVADGLGCVDHAWFGRFHIPCAFAAKDDSFDAAVPDDQWPPPDGDPIDPPTVVFAAGGLVLGPTRPELSEEILPFLGPNHTAEDAVRLNTILNPQQPVDRPGRHRAPTSEDQVSYDICLTIDTGGEEPAVVWDGWNFTSNVSVMWRAAGSDLAKHDGKKAGAVADELEAAIKVMEAEPDEFRKMDSSNGWGTYDDLMPRLRVLLEAYKAHPLATVSVWR